MALPKSSNLLRFALIFAVIYLGSQFVLRMYFPEQFGGKPAAPGIHLRLGTTSLTEGNDTEIIIENKTTTDLRLPSRCPSPPVDIFYVENPGATPERLTPMDATDIAAPCPDPDVILAGATANIPLAPWKYSIFSRKGTYELRLPSSVIPTATPPSGSSGANSGSLTASGAGSPGSQWAPGSTEPRVDVLAARLVLKEPGPFTKLFRTFITAPLLNLLLLIGSVVPLHDLGLSIILLTIIVKLVLFWPTHKAMEGQRKMQMMQPKLDALQKKYPDDSKKVQEETMKLWKEHKINPLSSCLPTLIQFPILIGLFYVIKDSYALELSRHLLYPMFLHMNWVFHTTFLGLDLLKPSIFLMPPLLVIMQFLQMKLTFAIADRKKKGKEEVIDIPTGKEGKTKEPLTQQQIQQRMMLYGLPLMIGVFAFQFPAAVSLYWGVSTLFAIGQQLIVNREHLRA